MPAPESRSTARAATKNGPPQTDVPQSAPPLSIMLVDDHPLWRSTLRLLIERAGVGVVVEEASDGAEAVEKGLKANPDVVLMDMVLPVMDGIEATRQILAQRKHIKVLVLASSEARSTVLASVRAGASGYLLKTSGAREVADAIRRVVAGEPVFPARLTRMVLDEFRRMSDASGPLASSIRIAIGGDSVIHRESLARTLVERGFEVEHVVGDVNLLARNASDINLVILDFHGADGVSDRSLHAAGQLRAAHPDLPLVVLAQGFEPGAVIELVKAGRVGYLLRESVGDLDELVDAIERVAQGESVIDPVVASGMVEAPEQRGSLSGLTVREREVLGLMAEGHSNPAISRKLFLSGKTVEKHVKSIFKKLELEDTTDYHRRVLAVITHLRSA